MSEQAAVDKTAQPNTVETIRRDLERLGLSTGDTVIVHSSLSAIGWVCGGPVAVVQALLVAVGPQGTVVMPAHTSDNSDPAEWRHPPVPTDWLETIRAAMPAFEADISPSRGMGRIAECFRTYPGTVRSDHPQVSFAANGREAGGITVDHVLTPSLGPDTPLGALYRCRSKILLLGVGYDRCTAFHLAEATSGVVPMVGAGCAMLDAGARVWRWFEDFDYDSDDFVQIGADLDASGGVTVGQVGCATSRLMGFTGTVDFARDWVRRRRRLAA